MLVFQGEFPMDYKQQYIKWLNFSHNDKSISDELEAIKDDEYQIKERFSSSLEFGTAGLRGILRAGTNGMNIYTVSQATKALSHLINKELLSDKGVVIASDTRIKSDEFSKVCACILAQSGIKAYYFDAPKPTPELSFAIRHLNAAAGINITASHNPKEYNGYKVYWSDGAQISPKQAKVVSDAINDIDVLESYGKIDFEKGIKEGLIQVIGKDIDEKYIETVLSQSIKKDVLRNAPEDFGVVYTAFHGTGAKLVPEVLKRAGLESLYCVQEQLIPDGTFPTVKSPNPEDKEGFNLAKDLAKEQNCSLVIGTDPDADRVGAMVRTSDDEFTALTGNQIGVLLLNYMIEAKKENKTLPDNAAVVKSIVSTPLADKICEKNGVTLINVLTGFKFIGEKMTQFEKTKEHTFILGFEESYGYLTGTYARDKDAVCASLLITEMAAYYHTKGKTFCDVLYDIYDEYGYYLESVDNIVFSGVDGVRKMKDLMKAQRHNPISIIDDKKVVCFADYLAENTNTSLPKSDVLSYTFDGGDTVIIRPSGTEPKIKIYYLVSAKDKESAQKKQQQYKDYFKNLFS